MDLLLSIFIIYTTLEYRPKDREEKKNLYGVMCLPYQKLLFIAWSEKIIFWFDEEYDMSTHRKHTEK